ncbi:MAG: hypothetical protein ABSE62_09345 [Chthoniobacteraceae bacterium]|jgi:hypothetical protein
MIQKAQVILITTLTAIIYGIIHDEITARVCIEYFTVAHPRLFETDSPTILGFCWGVLATFALGAVMGAILADVSQAGDAPPYPIAGICHSLLLLFGPMALFTFSAGLLGFELSSHHIVRLPLEFAQSVAPQHHDRFMAVWFAHAASYIAGLTGGILLIVHIWRLRGKPRVLTVVPRTGGALIRALILTALAILVLYIRLVHS